MNYCKGRALTCLLLVLLSSGMFSPSLHAQNKVLGELELVSASKVENTSGVWVDGQYVGYLSELKGSKKLLLLPGEHEIDVRQGGYLDFVQTVSVRAGEKQSIDVKMEKDTRMPLPKITAEIKLDVKPNRAAVFVDGVFIGHIAEFSGVGKALLVAPGKAQNQNQFAGIPHFRDRYRPDANQKSTIKTDMVTGGPAEGTPLPQ